MRIQIASDLHCEHYQDYEYDLLAKFPIPSDSKTIDLFLAGDIFQASAFSEQETSRLFNFFCRKYRKVFYLPGNHEYYGSNPSQTLDKIRILSKHDDRINLNVLSNSKIFISHYGRILGGTLWFPENPNYIWHKNNMNDFNLIKNFVPWVFDENIELVKFLDKNLRPNDIVMTHHLVHKKSIPKNFINSPLNMFFMTELEGLIRERKPKLWIHGHSHVPVDYKLGSTRIISNPYGYPSENKYKKSFKQGIIEI